MSYREHKRVTLSCGPGLTKQSFKDECDINSIMAKYEKTGLIEHQKAHSGFYGDYINAPDYHTAMNMIIEANEMFMTIPARIRAQFDHDAQAFLEFAQDPANREELVEMGLAPHVAASRAPEASQGHSKTSRATAPKDPKESAGDVAQAAD